MSDPDYPPRIGGEGEELQIDYPRDVIDTALAAAGVGADVRAAMYAADDPLDPMSLAAAAVRMGAMSEEVGAAMAKLPRLGEPASVEAIRALYDAAEAGAMETWAGPGALMAGAVVMVPGPIAGTYVIQCIHSGAPLYQPPAGVTTGTIIGFSHSLYELTHGWRPFDLEDKATWPEHLARVLVHDASPEEGDFYGVRAFYADVAPNFDGWIIRPERTVHWRTLPPTPQQSKAETDD